MLKRIFASLQYALPQHLLSRLLGWIADSRVPWLKNFLIKQFVKHYQIDLTENIIQDPYAYPSFNQFFIRKLNLKLRPMSLGENEIVSPVDGSIAALGAIHKNQLLQAKNIYFNLETLLGQDPIATRFYDGTFLTAYLAPHHYHRVHMPLAGQLQKTIYIPGQLFSVNRMTSELIPNLYGRNERFITLFETEAGCMAVIFVGALIVGSIQTTWMDHPIRSTAILTENQPNKMRFEKGAELGYFKMGSTIILLYENKKEVRWDPSLSVHSSIKLGQFLGNFNKKD